MDGLQFEHRCAELLRYRGFHKVTVTKGSGDQGVDILAQKNGLKYGIQCKYYSHPVGNKAIQEAYAGADFYDCDAAMVMTNNTFTRAARELAEKLEVELWEYCSPNGSSPLITRLMRIFNVFFLLTGVAMSISASLLDFPQEYSYKLYGISHADSCRIVRPDRLESFPAMYTVRNVVLWFFSGFCASTDTSVRFQLVRNPDVASGSDHRRSRTVRKISESGTGLSSKVPASDHVRLSSHEYGPHFLRRK